MNECPIGIRFFGKQVFIRSCTLSVLMSKSSCDVGKTTFFKKSHAAGIDRKSLSLVCPSEVHKERGQ